MLPVVDHNQVKTAFSRQTPKLGKNRGKDVDLLQKLAGNGASLTNILLRKQATMTAIIMC